MAGMTKSRYVMIAETINGQRTNPATGRRYGRVVQETVTDVAKGLADAFQKDNPQFQRGWFLAIAGCVHCTLCGAQLDSYGQDAKNGRCPDVTRGSGKWHYPSEPL